MPERVRFDGLVHPIELSLRCVSLGVPTSDRGLKTTASFSR
jgi:hypothetical protein